eukprot:952104-Rhodomonas_salina.2
MPIPVSPCTWPLFCVRVNKEPKHHARLFKGSPRRHCAVLEATVSSMQVIKLHVAFPCENTGISYHTLEMQVNESLNMEDFQEAVRAHVKKEFGNKHWIIASRCMGWIDTPNVCWMTYFTFKDDFLVTENKYATSKEMCDELDNFT